MRRAALIAGLVFLGVAIAFGGRRGLAPIDADSPAIKYTEGMLDDPGFKLNLKLQRGEAHLKFERLQGYLRAVLNELDVPIESQIVVFSKTSFQADRISPSNPRSLFFNDSVIVGWVHGGPIIEFAAEDPKQGMVFYKLPQSPSGPVRLSRDPNCLNCHVSDLTLGVPGTLMHSVFPGPDGSPIAGAGDYLTDDRSPFAQRWGGWYVTGTTGSLPHMGNAIASSAPGGRATLSGQSLNLESLKGRFDTDAYLSPYSDVVALMVFEHEIHVMNLFTRMGWQARLASYQDGGDEYGGGKLDRASAKILRENARELVDYMFFVDESPLTSRVQGTSGFAEKFSSEGPFDSKGRSLRQFDLQRRLMRYPCSFMIYSDAFDGLPDEAKDAVYQRMWKILSGQERGKRYAKLTFGDRRAIVEILRDTKRRLPAYFQPVAR
jgi:hypothetical protein